MRRSALLVLVALCAAAQAPPDPSRRRIIKKPEQEPPTQVLELPKEPPMAVMAEAGKLVFRVTPLSSKGLLSQQIRDALKWLTRDRASIVKLRAFVAGSGDVRRVQAVVSEIFTDRRLPLPALSVLQAGALPQDGAQVVFEAWAVEPKRTPNPDGLLFLPGRPVFVDQPYQPMQPLAEKALTDLQTTLARAGLGGEDLLRASCFVSALDGVEYLRKRAYTEWPRAVWNFIQYNREPARSMVQCEAVARLRKPPGDAGAGLVGPGRIVLTGMQLGFGAEPEDVRLGFQRLGKALEHAGASPATVFYTNYYPLTWRMGDLVRAAGPEFFSRERPPAIGMMAVEGLPGLDASFGIDAIAVTAAKK